MKLLALVLSMSASLAFAQQQGRGTHYAITETTVANLLRANGTNVAASQVHLPMQLAAATPDPRLEIVATRRVTEHEVDLEVHCRVTTECLPFDALVDINDANKIAASVQETPLLDRSGQQPGAHEVSGRSSSSAQSTASPSDHLRAGTEAVLIIDDGHMRIHLPVIAVDSGAKGTLIRVCTSDRKKIFHAVVVDGGTVQGAVE